MKFWRGDSFTFKRKGQAQWNPLSFSRLGFQKRGLSPVIASVLLILLVLVLAAIIFLWAMGFLGEQIQKFGMPIEDACGKIKFEAQVVDSDTGDYAMEVTNYGDVDIFNLDVKKFYKGDTETEEFTFNVDRGAAVIEPVILLMTEGDYTDTPEKIVVYPSLLGNVRGKDRNKPYVCEDQGITIHLTDDDI